ncbi:MAG: type II CAAX endopeptidase family protein [Pirellulaceae bacterium]
MARSSKEGQYYLMPLMMVTLPLVLIPVLPGTTLTVRYTMIPVTGLFLVVKAFVEGQYAEAVMHLPIVAVVTFGCLYLAVRWAQRQFESEQVLFRDGDQLKLGDWLRHLRRDRHPVASTGHAIMCGMVILIMLFYGRLVVTSQPEGWRDLALAVVLPQIGMILGPTLIMAAMLTTGLRTSLRIRLPQRGAMLTALVLGFTLHPLYTQFGSLIQYFWPISPVAQEAMAPLMQSIMQQPLLLIIVVMALIPAVCEELAFRGFIFGGLARNHGGLRAVLVTALMFGFSHAVFQQSVTATAMGCVIGWIALRTGSVLPGIVLHVTNNALTLAIGKLTLHPEMFDSWIGHFLRADENGQPTYQLIWTIVSASIAFACLMYYSLFHDQDSDDRDLRRDEEEWFEQQEPTADGESREERKSLIEVV